MIKEYAIYPFKYMNITQRHDQGNHIYHWEASTNYSDLPWDEGCQDGGRSYFEPQNDFIVEEVLGLGSNTTNTVRLRSVNKLYISYKLEPDYLYLTLSHMNEDNLNQVKVGDVLKKDTKLLMEGTDGLATGNHFRITTNLGKYYGFLKNSNGAWCFTYQQSLLPNEAFYYDKQYTNIINSANYVFKPKPVDVVQIGKPIERNELVNQIEIINNNIYCRETPGLNGKILGYIKEGIYKYIGKMEIDGYAWYNIETGWVAYSDEWSILYPKKDPIVNETKENILSKIIKWIVKIFKIK